MQNSVVSQNMANPSLFHLPNRVSEFAGLRIPRDNFLISNYIKSADVFHSSPYPHFKGMVPV